MPEEDSDKGRDIDLLYVGSLVSRKDPKFLKKSLRRAEEAGFDVATVNYKRLDLPGKTYTDVSEEKLAELYSRARFYLHPSLAEGFGRTPVEAQKYGAIPLARDILVNSEVLGKAWIKVDSPDEVVGRLKETDLAHNYLRGECRKNASRFKWEKTREKIAEVLRG